MFESILQIFQHQQATREPITDVEQIKQGCYYLTPREKGGYTVKRVLKTDEYGVHLRSYSNIFTIIPDTLDIDDLFMASMDDISDEIEMGMGHMPVSYESFLTWQAIDLNICKSVEEDELEGYYMWEEAEGGYF